MSFSEKLQKIKSKYNNMGERLFDPEAMTNQQFVELSREYSELAPIIESIDEYNKIHFQLADVKELLADPEIEAEMKDIAEQELYELKDKLSEVEYKVKVSLLPKDRDDNKNAILEIRAGTGGEEAALFAAVLFRMYQRFAELRKWKFEILELSETGIGGLKEGSASISGNNVFALLKYESGVHRVQRVPETESSGRIHTSAATVAVLPEAEDFDINIDEKDLRVDVYRASGAGGQHVNTTESAVRIVHLPSGITVAMQDEKSQHKNKDKALKVLKARLYEYEKRQRDSERSAQRKGQVGSGDRSERIRTYNYPQGRVTDHRINLTLYKINEITQQGQLDEIINALITEDEARRLSESI